MACKGMAEVCLLCWLGCSVAASLVCSRVDKAPNWLQSGNLLLLWDAAAVFWKEHSELAAVGKELRDC